MATWPISPSGSVGDLLGEPMVHRRGHIVLVGLPGSGKSTVGPLLATALGRPFLDFDAEIGRRVGISIYQLFAERGEAVFRSLERALTEELRAREPMVLAPGGGWVTQPGTVALLRPPGRLVYLRSTAAATLARMGEGVAGRPLLAASDPLRELESLLAIRRPLYEAADLVVDVDSLDPQRVTTEIVALAQR